MREVLQKIKDYFIILCIMLAKILNGEDNVQE